MFASKPLDTVAPIEAIYTLERIMLADNRFAGQIIETVRGFIMQRAGKDPLYPPETHFYSECAPPAKANLTDPNDTPVPGRREDADPTVQAGMLVLSRAKAGAIRLDHTYLDDVDLAGAELRGILLSQAWLRRASLNSANLQGADLRGVTMGDWHVSGWTAKIGTALVDNGIGEELRPIQAWQRYRCWIADLRYAHLENANFEGAGLEAADMRYTHVRGAIFTNANLSRTDLRGSDITYDQLNSACSDETTNHDVKGADGAKFKIKPCPR